MKLTQSLLSVIIIFHSSLAQSSNDYCVVVIPINRVQIRDSLKKNNGETNKLPFHFLILFETNEEKKQAISRKAIPDCRISSLTPQDCVFRLEGKSDDELQRIHSKLTTQYPRRILPIDPLIISQYGKDRICDAINKIEKDNYTDAGFKPPSSNEIYQIIDGYTIETSNYQRAGDDNKSKTNQLITNYKKQLNRHKYKDAHNKDDTLTEESESIKKKQVPFVSPYTEVISDKKPKKGCCYFCLPHRKKERLFCISRGSCKHGVTLQIQNQPLE